MTLAPRRVPTPTAVRPGLPPAPRTKVVTHPDTGLPHLRYINRPDMTTAMSGSSDGGREPINVEELGPVARAWYGVITDGRR